MNPSPSTRIAAGVTATYLRDITRRPQPAPEHDARRATHGRRPDRGLRASRTAGARRTR
jgi:hypothetical protein